MDRKHLNEDEKDHLERLLSMYGSYLRESMGKPNLKRIIDLLLKERGSTQQTRRGNGRTT